MTRTAVKAKKTAEETVEVPLEQLEYRSYDIYDSVVYDQFNLAPGTSREELSQHIWEKHWGDRTPEEVAQTEMYEEAVRVDNLRKRQKRGRDDRITVSGPEISQMQISVDLSQKPWHRRSNGRRSKPKRQL